MTAKLRSVIAGTLVALALAVVAHGQATGTISGVVSGPDGPLANVTINIIDSNGKVVATTVTSANGSYSVPNLPPGTYTVQVVTNNKPVGTAVVTVAAGVTGTANVTLTASQLAAAGIAAGGGGVSAKTVLIIAGLTGAAIGTYFALKDDPSPTQ